MTGADGCTFILLREGQCYYVDEYAIGPLWKGALFPVKDCISGWAMIHRQSVSVPDIYKDDRIPHELYRSTFVKSLTIVPIRTLDPIVAIGTYWADTHIAATEEIDLLQSLADIIAVSMENIRVHDELEQRVAERTQSLEEVNAELELFSYSVSHDLRAPLRGINGFSTILIEEHSEKLGNDAKLILSKIIANIKKMNGLIEDLSDLFRTGKRELQKIVLPMTQLVTEISDELKEQEKNRNISITIHKPPDASGDSTLIKQVLQNLVGNAIKYSGKRLHALIEIGCEAKDGKNTYYIKDNGAGFDMKYYGNLFSVFQRLHAQRDFEGTGVGLAIVQKIISKHGGKIWAESQIDHGATFYFTL